MGKVERKTKKKSSLLFFTYFSVGYSMIFVIIALGVIGCSVRAVTDWWIAQTDTGISIINLLFLSFILLESFGVLFVTLLLFLFIQIFL
jgi:hypothetical protein